MKAPNKIKAGCSLNVKFSSGFPRNLAVNPLCYATDLSNSTYPLCTANKRTISVAVDKEWNRTDTNFNISIFGVNMPNSGNPFKEFIFFSQCGTAMVDYTKVAVAGVASGLPVHMHITNLESSSKYTGAISQLYINFMTLGSSFPANADDQIWVDFPSDFDLDVVKDSARCDSKIISSTQLDYCRLTRQRAAISAFAGSYTVSPADTQGVNVLDIENPLAVGTPPYVSVGIYQKSGKKVAARTYDNLNRVDMLAYEAGGQSSSINGGNRWTMNRGTRTSAMYFTFITPTTVNATVTATSGSGIRVFPNPVPIVAGTLSSEFRVSADINAELGEYAIKWTIDGTWTTPAFASFKRSYFTVTDNRDDTISVAEPGYVPLGGTSLPLNVSLSSAVDNLLTVTVTQLSTIPTGSVYSPQILKFEEGDQYKTFTISIPANSTGTYGEFLVSKGGIDADTYNVVKPLITFSVSRSDGSRPQVYNYLLSSVAKHSASFLVTTEKPVKLYTALCLYGTKTPSLNETMQGYLDSPGDLYEKPTFTTFYEYTLSSSKYQYSFSLNNLRAQTSYVLYIYVVDLSGNVAEKSLQINFETDKRYASAIRTLKFTESLSNSTNYLSDFAKALGISESRVATYEAVGSSPGTGNATAYPSSSGLSRRLEAVDYQIILYTDPSDTSQNTPKILLDKLTTLDDFKLRYPSYDTSSSAAIELTGSAPVFSRTPKFGSALGGVLKLVNLALTSDGYVYICVAETTEGAPDAIPWQTFAGVDSWNFPCTSTVKMRVNTSPLEAELTGLEINKRYTAYITASNLLPRYPDLADNVISDNFTTFGLASKETTGDESAAWSILVGWAVILAAF
mmetsp:Transcript_27656/g.49940  ORF Transcript_27656/g.49940 Transcript_27656/m.49940 type:complete len:850 (+) Transcript_27656:3522-6071(+)